jgi:hypothetical protein
MNVAISIFGKKGTSPAKIKDFMPMWDREDKVKAPPVQSIEDMKAALYAIAKTANAANRGKVQTKKRTPK